MYNNTLHLGQNARLVALDRQQNGCTVPLCTEIFSQQTYTATHTKKKPTLTMFRRAQARPVVQALHLPQLAANALTVVV
jgi:hypothetical protein